MTRQHFNKIGKALTFAEDKLPVCVYFVHEVRGMIEELNTNMTCMF